MFQEGTITDETVKEHLQAGENIIRFKHEHGCFLEFVVFHKFGTIVIQSPFFDQFYVGSPCHAICQYKNLKGQKQWHRPEFFMFSLPGHRLIRVGNRIALIYGKLTEFSILTRFRKLPKHWINWESLVMALKMGR